MNKELAKRANRRQAKGAKKPMKLSAPATTIKVHDPALATTLTLAITLTPNL